METIASIAPSLDRFFVEVLVNCPEEDLKRNRLALLASIRQEFTRLADFSEIVVEKAEKRERRRSHETRVLVRQRRGRGRGPRQGDARRQGRGPRGDDGARHPGPARVHDRDLGLRRLLARREPRRHPRGGRVRARAARARRRQALRRPAEPAARLGPLRRPQLDARDDGHDPEPGPDLADASTGLAGALGRPLRARLPAAVPRDVRRRRAARAAPRVREGDGRGQEGPRRRRPTAT